MWMALADPGFSQRGDRSQRLSLGQNLLFNKFYAENYMKMKEILARAGVPGAPPSLDPPMDTSITFCRRCSL